MANTTTNMGLTLNVVGITQDPIWSNNINGDWSIIDAHDHSVGKGAQVTPAGLNINSDLSFNFNNVTSIRSWQGQNQTAFLALPTDINCGYFVNGNFTINNSSGTPVQITSGAGLNIASLGTIGGDFGGLNPAAVTYSNVTKNFAFTQSPNTPASLSVNSVAFGYPSASPQFVTLGAPATVSSYTITLPAAVAASASVMTFDTSGNASFTPYTSANTPSTVVTRDSSGNINAVGLTVTTLTAASSTIALVGNETISGTLGVTGQISGGSLSTAGGLAVSGTASLTTVTVGGNTTTSGYINPLGGIYSTQGSALLKNAYYSGSIGGNGNATITVSGATTVLGINGIYTPGGSGNSYFIYPANVTSIPANTVNAYSPTATTVRLQNYFPSTSCNYQIVVTYY
jgi:hypothetical protein